MRAKLPRPLHKTTPGAKAIGREPKQIVPQMERETEQLGRPASARTAAINEVD